MSVPEIPRNDVDQTADEGTTLDQMLDFLRATVVNKVAGLTDRQARTAVPPSTMTPLGLVKHLTGVERWWFSIDFAADPDAVEPWPDGEPFDGFELSDADTLESVVEAYLTECAASRAVVASAPSLSEPAKGPDMHFHLRYALVHMIEETSRHCGHLDYMREALDGKRGQLLRHRRTGFQQRRP